MLKMSSIIKSLSDSSAYHEFDSIEIIIERNFPNLLIDQLKHIRIAIDKMIRKKILLPVDCAYSNDDGSISTCLKPNPYYFCHSFGVQSFQEILNHERLKSILSDLAFYQQKGCTITEFESIYDDKHLHPHFDKLDALGLIIKRVLIEYSSNSEVSSLSRTAIYHLPRFAFHDANDVIFDATAIELTSILDYISNWMKINRKVNIDVEEFVSVFNLSPKDVLFLFSRSAEMFISTDIIYEEGVLKLACLNYGECPPAIGIVNARNICSLSVHFYTLVNLCKDEFSNYTLKYLVGAHPKKHESLLASLASTFNYDLRMIQDSRNNIHVVSPSTSNQMYSLRDTIENIRCFQASSSNIYFSYPLHDISKATQQQSGLKLSEQKLQRHSDILSFLTDLNGNSIDEYELISNLRKNFISFKNIDSKTILRCFHNLSSEGKVFCSSILFPSFLNMKPDFFKAISLAGPDQELSAKNAYFNKVKTYVLEKSKILNAHYKALGMATFDAANAAMNLILDSDPNCTIFNILGYSVPDVFQVIKIFHSELISIITSESTFNLSKVIKVFPFRILLQCFGLPEEYRLFLAGLFSLKEDDRFPKASLLPIRYLKNDSLLKDFLLKLHHNDFTNKLHSFYYNESLKVLNILVECEFIRESPPHTSTLEKTDFSERDNFLLLNYKNIFSGVMLNSFSEFWSYLEETLATLNPITLNRLQILRKLSFTRRDSCTSIDAVISIIAKYYEETILREGNSDVSEDSIYSISEKSYSEDDVSTEFHVKEVNIQEGSCNEAVTSIDDNETRKRKIYFKNYEILKRPRLQITTRSLSQDKNWDVFDDIVLIQTAVQSLLNSLQFYQNSNILDIDIETIPLDEVLLKGSTSFNCKRRYVTVLPRFDSVEDMIIFVLLYFFQHTDVCKLNQQLLKHLISDLNAGLILHFDRKVETFPESNNLRSRLLNTLTSEVCDIFRMMVNSYSVFNESLILMNLMYSTCSRYKERVCVYGTKIGDHLKTDLDIFISYGETNDVNDNSSIILSKENNVICDALGIFQIGIPNGLPHRQGEIRDVSGNFSETVIDSSTRDHIFFLLFNIPHATLARIQSRLPCRDKFEIESLLNKLISMNYVYTKSLRSSKIRSRTTSFQSKTFNCFEEVVYLISPKYFEKVNF